MIVSRLFVCVRSFVHLRPRFDSVRFGLYTHPFVYSLPPSQSSVDSAIRSGNVNAWMQTVLSTVSTLGNPSSARRPKSVSAQPQSSTTRRLLQSSSDEDSASEQRSTRLKVKQLLASSVVNMAAASFSTTESLRQQLQLVSEILRCDQSSSSPVFVFVGGWGREWGREERKKEYVMIYPLK